MVTSSVFPLGRFLLKVVSLYTSTTSGSSFGLPSLATKVRRMMISCPDGGCDFNEISSTLCCC